MKNPQVSPGLEQTHQTGSWVDTAASILNGFWGDYLHQSQNELAIEMALVHRTQAADGGLSSGLSSGLSGGAPRFGGRVCILVHGLACNESIWRYRAPGDLGVSGSGAGVTDYGEQLAAQLGFTPFYLRYNTGLALADNGRQLAGLLDRLAAVYPVAIEDLVLIGHSMGGLVIRHAYAAALQLEQPWAAQVSRIVYLGSPHEGAPLARLSHSAARWLSAVPDPVARLVGSLLEGRSAGIKDLRHGNATQTPANSRPLAPFPAGVRNYVVAGTLGADPHSLHGRVLGDGLVTPPRHDWPELDAVAAVKLFPGAHHLRLTGDAQVCAQIVQWCREERMA